MRQKKLKPVETVKLQVSTDGRTHRITIPVPYIREMEKLLGWDLEQKDLVAISLLDSLQEFDFARIKGKPALILWPVDV